MDHILALATHYDDYGMNSCQDIERTRLRLTDRLTDEMRHNKI
jgi:hypothetical protein